MRKLVKRALKKGLIRKEGNRECTKEGCTNDKIRYTFTFHLGGGEFGNVCYCEECINKMLSGVESL